MNTAYRPESPIRTEAFCLLACLASTVFMTGLIWFVQVVHYPLFERVGSNFFKGYHAAHSSRTTLVVVVPMVVELLTSGWLAFRRPSGPQDRLATVGLALALFVWGSTFFLQVPRHSELAYGFRSSAHHQLVLSNWLRTAAWSGHSSVLLLMTWRTLVEPRDRAKETFPVEPN